VSVQLLWMWTLFLTWIGYNLVFCCVIVIYFCILIGCTFVASLINHFLFVFVNTVLHWKLSTHICENKWKTGEDYKEKKTAEFIIRIVYSQLSNSIGHFCVSSGYLCNFIGHDSVAVILRQKYIQTVNIVPWRFSVAVTRWSRSTQLLYVEPG